MHNPPKTLKEARAYRYNVWAGNPEGYRFKEGFCAYEVREKARWPSYHQCQRAPNPNYNGAGANGLYCGIHAKVVQRKAQEE